MTASLLLKILTVCAITANIVEITYMIKQCKNKTLSDKYNIIWKLVMIIAFLYLLVRH